jgi:hypothetical protein
VAGDVSPCLSSPLDVSVREAIGILRAAGSTVRPQSASWPPAGSGVGGTRGDRPASGRYGIAGWKSPNRSAPFWITP